MVSLGKGSNISAVGMWNGTIFYGVKVYLGVTFSVKNGILRERIRPRGGAFPVSKFSHP